MPKFDTYDQLFSKVAANKDGLTKEQFALDMSDPQKANKLFNNISSLNDGTVPSNFGDFVKLYGFNKPLTPTIKKAVQQQQTASKKQGEQPQSWEAAATPQKYAPLKLPDNFDYSMAGNNPEAQAMIKQSQQRYQDQLKAQAEEQQKMQDSFRLSTGLYKQNNGTIQPIEQDPEKFNKLYGKSADKYFLTNFNTKWSDEEKKTIPLVQEYYNATTDEQRADLRKEIRELNPQWNPLPEDQWKILDSMKIGVYENTAGTSHAAHQEFNSDPVSYQLNELLSEGDTPNKTADQAANQAETFARAYYLGENIHDISNWGAFGQKVVKSLTDPVSNWVGRYQTNDEYTKNLNGMYNQYFLQQNVQNGVENPNKQAGEDTKKIMDIVQTKTLNPTLLRQISETAGGVVGSLPYFAAASFAGNWAADIGTLSKGLITSGDLMPSLAGQFMQKTLRNGVPMALLNDDKRAGLMQGIMFGEAGALANKLGLSVDGVAYNGAMKLAMKYLVNPVAKGTIKGAAAAGTQVGFDAIQALANSSDFANDLKNKGLDWLTQEGKSFIAQGVVFGVMGAFEGNDPDKQAENIGKEFDQQIRKTKDKADKEKLIKQKNDILATAAEMKKGGSELNKNIIDHAANANTEHMAPPSVISHTTPDGTHIRTTNHVDIENRNITIPSNSLAGIPASDYTDNALKTNGIGELSFTDKKEADGYVDGLREKGANAYVISTGTIENPQYHVIAYDKSKAVEAKSLNDLRVKETQGHALTIDEAATMAGLRGQDPLDELYKIKQQSEEAGIGMQAAKVQNKIDEIKIARENQALKNDIVDKIEDIKTEQDKKLPSQKAISDKQAGIKKIAAEHGWNAEIKKNGDIEVKDENGTPVVSNKTKPAFSKEGLTQLQEIIDNHAKSANPEQKADFFKQAQEVANKEGMTMGYDHNDRIVAPRGSKVVVSAQIGYKSLDEFKKQSPELAKLIDDNNIFYRLTNLPSDKKNFSVVIPGMDDANVKQAINEIFSGQSTYHTEKLLNRLAKYADGTELVQLKSTTGRKSTMMMPDFLQKTEGDLGKVMESSKPQTTTNFTDDNSSTVEESNVGDYLKTKGAENVQKERFDSLDKEKKNAIDSFIDDVMLGRKKPTDDQKKLAADNADLIEHRVMQKQVEAQSKPYQYNVDFPTDPATPEEKVGMEEPATVIDTNKEGKKVIERKKTTKEIVAALSPELQKRTVVVPRTAVDLLAGAARMGKFQEYMSGTPEYSKYSALNVDNATMSMFKDGLITFDDANRITDNDSQYNMQQLEQLTKPVARMKSLAEQTMDEELPKKAPVTQSKKKVITPASYKNILENIKKGDGEAIKEWAGRNGKVYDLDADALKHSEVNNIIDGLKAKGVIDANQWQELATEWKKQQINQSKVITSQPNEVADTIDRLKKQRAEQKSGKTGDIYKDVAQQGGIKIPDKIARFFTKQGQAVGDIGRALRNIRFNDGSTPEEKALRESFLKNNRYKTWKACLQAIKTDESAGSTAALQRFLGAPKPGFEPSDAALIKADNAYRDIIVNSYDAAKGENEIDFKDNLRMYASSLAPHIEELPEGTEKEHFKNIVSKASAAADAIRNKNDMDNFVKIAMGMVRYKIGNEMVLPQNLHEMKLLEGMEKQGIKPLTGEEHDYFKTLLPANDMLYTPERRGKTVFDKGNDLYKLVFASPQWFKNYALTDKGGKIASDVQFDVDKHLMRIPREQQTNYRLRLKEIGQNMNDRVGKVLAFGKYFGERIYSEKELKDGIDTDEGKIVLNDNEIQAYNQFHELNGELGELKVQAERMKDTSYDGLTDAQKVQWNKNKREELLGLGGHVPINREGDFAVFAHGTNWLSGGKVGSSEPVKNYWRFETQKEANDFAAKLSKIGYVGYGAKDSEGHPTPVPDSKPNVYQISQQANNIKDHMSNAHAASMIYDAILKNRDYDDLSKDEQQVLDAIENKQSEFLEKGKRKKIFKAVPGIDPSAENLMRSMDTEINRVTMNLGRASSEYIFNKRIEQMPKEDSQLKDLMTDWHKNLNNKARTPIAGIASQYMYMKYLALNPAHVARVFYGNFTTIPTYLSSLGHSMDTNFHKEFVQSIGEAMKWTGEKNIGLGKVVSSLVNKVKAPEVMKLDPGLRNALERANSDGTIGTNSIDFALNNTAKSSQIIEKVTNASVLNIESYARTQAFILGYKAALRKGLTGEKAQDYATDVVYKTTNNYNRTNSPLIYGRNPDVANFIKMYTIFKQQHMNFNQLMAPVIGNTFESWKDARNTLRSQVPSLLAGGVSNMYNLPSLISRATPLISSSLQKYGFKGTVALSTPLIAMGAALVAANMAYNSATGQKDKSLFDHIDDACKEYNVEGLNDFIKDGSLGLLGTDASNLTDQGSTIGKGGFSSAGNTIESSMIRFATDLKEKNWKAAKMEAYPSAMGNWYKADLYQRNGLKLHEGVNWVPDELDANYMRFGLRPLSEKRAYDVKAIMKDYEDKKVTLSHVVQNEGKLTPETKSYIEELNSGYYEKMARAKDAAGTELHTDTKFNKRLKEGLITHRMVHDWLKKKK